MLSERNTKARQLRLKRIHELKLHVRWNLSTLKYTSHVITRTITIEIHSPNPIRTSSSSSLSMCLIPAISKLLVDCSFLVFAEGEQSQVSSPQLQSSPAHLQPSNGSSVSIFLHAGQGNVKSSKETLSIFLSTETKRLPMNAGSSSSSTSSTLLELCNLFSPSPTAAPPCFFSRTASSSLNGVFKSSGARGLLLVSHLAVSFHFSMVIEETTLAHLFTLARLSSPERLEEWFEWLVLVPFDSPVSNSAFHVPTLDVDLDFITAWPPSISFFLPPSLAPPFELLHSRRSIERVSSRRCSNTQPCSRVLERASSRERRLGRMLFAVPDDCGPARLPLAVSLLPCPFRDTSRQSMNSSSRSQPRKPGALIDVVRQTTAI